MDGQIENVVPDNEVVGAIHTVLAHPTNAKTLYVGSVNGGVWRTTNANDPPPEVEGAHRHDADLRDRRAGVRLSPTRRRNTLWAGVGKWSSFGRLGGNRVGLYQDRRTRGNSWTLVTGGGGILFGKNISGVAARGNTIVIAVNVADVFAFANIGIWRSTNGGATFTQIAVGNGAATGLPGGVTHDLVGDRAEPDPALHQRHLREPRRRRERRLPQHRHRRHLDQSQQRGDGRADPATNVTNNVEFAVGQHNNVYCAIVNSGRLAGLFRSGDGGTTWTAMDLPAHRPQQRRHPPRRAGLAPPLDRRRPHRRQHRLHRRRPPAVHRWRRVCRSRRSSPTASAPTTSRAASSAATRALRRGQPVHSAHPRRHGRRTARRTPTRGR